MPVSFGGQAFVVLYILIIYVVFFDAPATIIRSALRFHRVAVGLAVLDFLPPGKDYPVSFVF